jgi:ribulose-5-phosphate 4-epimerase/fuculose-1-phosphate aldolase
VTGGSVPAKDRPLREEIALGCRVLARLGMATGVLGHISARVSDDEILIRCRGPREMGLGHTTAGDIHRVGLDGKLVDGEPGWSVPKETPLHTAVLRARGQVGAVVHAHPPSALLFGLADLEAVPAFGAYNIPAMRIARAGIPVYPRPVLITGEDLGAEIVSVMGGSSVCILRGHGIVTVGSTVRQAVVAAVNLETVCRVAVELRRLGAQPDPLSEADLAEIPDLGSAFDDELAWQALVADLR